MLHEVLLALSGHPSPLFDGSSDKTAAQDFPLLTSSERALLQSIGSLSETHRKLQLRLEIIRTSHASIVCRAVASSIEQTHLSRYQQTIVDVESKILSRDASLVGAYDIVPLANVVCEFDGWHRRMAWYWRLACFIDPSDPSDRVTRSEPATGCTGARLMNRLRDEIHTGFSDIRDDAIDLARVADAVWLKQLASWVVYGKLPQYGIQDFFVRQSDSNSKRFAQDGHLRPTFVGSSAATSILFIGKSLHQVQRLRQTRSIDAPYDSDLVTTHLRMLSSSSLPIQPAELSRVVSAIRTSLSRNVLQHLLPMSMTLQSLSCLRQYFLLDRTEFATSLITEAQSRVLSRQQEKGRLLQHDPVKALQALTIKDAELNQSLQQTWRAMFYEHEGVEDPVLDLAQQQISLVTLSPHDRRPSSSDSTTGTMPDLTTVTFNDLLFPTPTELTLAIHPPLDLLISAADVQNYSFINAYLLAIRRGCLKISDLWRNTSARRDPSKQRYQHQSRKRLKAVASRKVWATCSAANFMLSETAAFFESDIIRESCDHFQRWVEQPAPGLDASESGIMPDDIIKQERQAQRDPETLATGHRAFLASLMYSLLLTNVPYTKELRSLLSNMDSVIAFFTRLLDLQLKLDLESEAGGEAAHTIEEERRVALELDRARKKVDSDLKSVVHCLRQIDLERIGSLRHLEFLPPERGGFEPWKAGGVDRLLMRLEFGRMLEPIASTGDHQS